MICSEVCDPAQSAFTEYTKRSLYVMIFVAVKIEENMEQILQQTESLESPKEQSN
ncbi:hypothetical protein [Helicobacter ganmani]|uniref:hypothetical protein n=1 Tax=Helicobacter ganmani TaxID=60246 RepID=UPI003A83A86E